MEGNNKSRYQWTWKQETIGQINKEKVAGSLKKINMINFHQGWEIQKEKDTNHWYQD